jgi:hypothetical protein
VLELSPLSEASVRELVGRALPDAEPDLSAACLEATGGNPFLLRELLASAREHEELTAAGVAKLHPEAIHRSILVRLGRLGEEAGRLAVAVAVLGPAASAPLAAELAALEPGAATSAADALTAAQVLAPGPPLSFVHPIVREAAYADLPPGRRRKAHLAAARLLREAGRSAEEVASQLLAAGPVGEAWAAGVLREAAGQALGRGAPALAARLLRQALEEAEQGDPALLLELGRAEIAAADPAAPRHLEEARAAAREPQQRAMAAGALGQARYVLGDPGGDRATHRARPRRAVARRSRYGSRGDRLGAGTGRREGARERAASDGAGVDGVLPVAAGALRRGAGGCWPRSGAGEPAGQPARARPVPGASAGHLLAARRRQRLPRRCGDASGPKTGGLGDLERIGVLDSLLEVAPPMPRPRRPGQA